MAALEQAIVVNRFGAFIPAGTLYALKGDIVRRDGRATDWDRPAKSAGQVKLRSDKLVVLRGGKAPDHDEVETVQAFPVAFTALVLPLQSTVAVRDHRRNTG